MRRLVSLYQQGIMAGRGIPGLEVCEEEITAAKVGIFSQHV